MAVKHLVYYAQRWLGTPPSITLPELWVKFRVEIQFYPTSFEIGKINEEDFVVVHYKESEFDAYHHLRLAQFATGTNNPPYQITGSATQMQHARQILMSSCQELTSNIDVKLGLSPLDGRRRYYDTALRIVISIFCADTQTWDQGRILDSTYFIKGQSHKDVLNTYVSELELWFPRFLRDCNAIGTH